MPAGCAALSPASRQRDRGRSSRKCRRRPGRSPAPSRQPPFQRLQNTPLHREYDSDEGERVGDQAPDVKKLEEDLDRVADAIWAAEQLDDQHDLPDQREPGAGSNQKKWRQLGQDDLVKGAPATEMEAPRHVREIAVESARTLAQGH